MTSRTIVAPHIHHVVSCNGNHPIYFQTVLHILREISLRKVLSTEFAPVAMK